MAVNFRDLLPVAVGLLIVSVALGINAEVLTDIQADQTAGSYAYNVSERGLQAADELSTWLQLIALVFAAAIVIGVIFQSFGGFGKR